ncbi:MAG TPA: methionine--tRNA ligase [Candidatus Methanoculleus thermohydrogenotrophicum]|jgi:methionyl-tRNA synthetase|nr:methionine--tRNA ligase [Candidatus Methanoculleus thermohydrogenotrophicum]NLM82029.1 methionine--tRNA ligase [Candidatus Methanoculleus thermohydrogenotrophicum]HOB17280.1 methionine--tRNA ligase [Candidatus Methanoculleus thermohydrogenotrophicum]HPZ37435.1 methionine--tRNA ligase [Candidatus Methanoculleus thermohydrogenotrophicum]HQC90888.1 methionine--tRNA ligase [Candidatus Methanoculleus thermohydrogenotrophicum]
MSGKPLLVTCGLPYTNGPCHIGHLRTYVPADFYVRYMRRSGEEVVFICGSDNHGTPIVISAEREGLSPRELSERYHQHFYQTFRRMEIVFDRFGMTDDPMNHETTRSIVQRLIDNDYVYAKTISQSYCPECERFLPDRYVEGICPYCGAVARGDECDQGCGHHLEPGEIRDAICKICGGKAENREQEHYFFRLSAFRDFLLEYLPTLKGTATARNYALGWVKERLHDWCITRTMDWGVKFPGSDDLVVYVWVDAPIGYISFTKEWAEAAGADWKDYWCGDETRVTHFIGGDIVYHHCIFWPALLKAAGYGLPYAVVASGMVTIEGRKFSKSRGYVVWTNDDYLDVGLPADYLRYYLLSYTNHTKELDFSWKVYAERVNNEIVGTLGNFIYRTMYFAEKEFSGVPDLPATPAIIEEIERTLAAVDAEMRDYDFKNAVDSMMALASFGNSYIQKNAPWKLIKDDRSAAEQVIADCLQIVKALVLIFQPVMPASMQQAWMMLGYDDDIADHPISEATTPVGARALSKPTPLFAKIEKDLVKDLEKTLNMRVEEAEKAARREPTTVSIEDFANLDIRIAKVISAELIKGSKKLYKLIVDLGDEKRQVVSGIAEFYTPDELVGKDVVLIANLAPAKIFGVESRGMVLAAGDEASLLIPLRPVEPGTRVR